MLATTECLRGGKTRIPASGDADLDGVFSPYVHAMISRRKVRQIAWRSSAGSRKTRRTCSTPTREGRSPASTCATKARARCVPFPSAVSSPLSCVWHACVAVMLICAVVLVQFGDSCQFSHDSEVLRRAAAAASVAARGEPAFSQPAWSKGPWNRKTKLCKSFKEWGACQYGQACRFAHGPEELRVFDGWDPDVGKEVGLCQRVCV